MDKSISKTTAVLLFAVFGALLGLKFWADDKALDFRGPDHMHTDTAGNLYIQIGNVLLKHDDKGTYLTQYDLTAFGINDYYGDFSFFNNGDILIRRGTDELSILEKYKRYRRMTNKTPLAAANDESGLFRCSLETQQCSRFGDGAIDFNRTFHLSIDSQTENVYIADSSRHTLRLFDVNGVQLAVDNNGYKFPNQLSLIDNTLYVADTNHHRIISLDPSPDNFGKLIENHPILSDNPEVITVALQQLKSQIWPATFVHTKDLWWVNVMNNAMRDGDIYLFDPNWHLLGMLELPEGADPMDLVRYGDSILISDFTLNRVYRYDIDGNYVDDFDSTGLQQVIDANKTQQTQYKHLSYAALGSFITLFAGLLVYALVMQSRNRQQQTTSTTDMQQKVRHDVSVNKSSTSLYTDTVLPASEYTPQTYPFVFTGTAREYFGIWIINIVLIIVTLGIYSAWAKVRTKRYFYGNTLLADAPFDFPASPLAILKGWAIALGFFMLYNLSVSIFPPSALLFIILFFIGLPWLMVKAMAFRLHNTSYRNLRFYFKKDYKEAFKVFIGIGLLVPLTLGLIIPSYIYRQKKFIVTHSHYGTSPFLFKVVESKFYEIYGIAILILIVGGAGFALMSGLTASLLSSFTSDAFAQTFPAIPAGDQNKMPGLLAGLVIGVMYLGMSVLYLFFFSYINTRIHNTVWNGIEIAGNKFKSTLQVSKIAWIYLSNGLAIIFSFGLLVPWARIRMTRYKLENLHFIANTDLNGFIATEAQNVSATGEQIGEIFDFDIGL